jgi:hypothetical protein
MNCQRRVFATALMVAAMSGAVIGTAYTNFNNPTAVHAQTSPAFTVTQLSIGVLITGHNTGLITFCNSGALNTSISNGTNWVTTAVGKCAVLGKLPNLPVSSWQIMSTPSGSAAQFVNITNGQSYLCVTQTITGTNANPAAVGEVLGQCVLQGTASQ